MRVWTSKPRAVKPSKAAKLHCPAPVGSAAQMAGKDAYCGTPTGRVAQDGEEVTCGLCLRIMSQGPPLEAL